MHEHQPCRLESQVVCDPAWNTVSARVSGWLGTKVMELDIAVTPIRRLNPAVGPSAEVNAAWLRFPSFALERLAQVYRRLTESIYRYESGDRRFVADLEVNADGFVTNYPGGWRAEALT
jgi:hypothetical protein